MSRSVPLRSTLVIWSMLFVILSDGAVQSGINKWPPLAEELTWEQLRLVVVDHRGIETSGVNTVRTWDIARLREAASDSATVSRVYGRTLAENKMLDEVLDQSQFGPTVWVEVSDDGEWAAIRKPNHIHPGFQIWHVPSAKLLHTMNFAMQWNGGPSEFVRVGESMQLAVVQGADVGLWEVNSGVDLGLIPLDPVKETSIIHLESLPDKPWLWIGFGEGRIELWNLQTRQKMATYGQERGFLAGLSVTRCGTKLLLNDWIHGHSPWDVNSGELIKRIVRPSQRDEFSPDDSMVLSTRGQRLMIWDLESEQSLRQMTFDAEINDASWIEDQLTVFDVRGRTHRFRINAAALRRALDVR